jgi:signal peptidase I
MKARSLWRGVVLSTLLGVWSLSPYQVGVVEGHSMDPTLRSGQWVAIDRGYYRTHRPHPGEIVVFRHGGITYVKRVYGVEGQTIFFLAEAEGRPGARTFIEPVRPAQVERVRAAVRRRTTLSVRPLRIPPGSFFALGDALSNSIDSRDLGSIADEELIGRVQTLWGTPPAPELEIALPPVRRHRSTHRDHWHSETARALPTPALPGICSPPRNRAWLEVDPETEPSECTC